MSRSGAADLGRIRDVWALREEELAQVFDVGPDEVRRWLVEGVTEAHALDVSDMIEATAALQARIRPERVAEVVSPPAVALDGHSLLDLALGHRHAELRTVVARMFDLRRIQP